jgi:hypothetical protein
MSSERAWFLTATIALGRTVLSGGERGFAYYIPSESR